MVEEKYNAYNSRHATKFPEDNAIGYHTIWFHMISIPTVSGK